MRLCKMAISNIKHNIKNYFMYFFAMCFSVFTTYSFLSLALSKSVGEKVGSNSGFAALFISFAIIILVFVLFFLISSNNSFIRARKKEISTYALFGMQNSRIGRLLFLETLSLGVVATIVGIGLGIGFSKLTTMILLKMTLAEFTGDVSFDIEPSAIYITSIIFVGIFCLMGLSGNRVINKFKLVDLFKGSKMAEGRSKGSYLILAISLALIIGGYYLAVTLGAMQVITFMVLILIMVKWVPTYFSGEASKS